MKQIIKLNLADYFTLTGLFFAWLSIILLINHQVNFAIIIIMIAFIFDLLDGYTARKIGVSEIFGRHLDSYADIFINLIFTSLLFYLYIAPNHIVGFTITFLILLFGGLRLIRYNLEGIQKTKKVSYYRGITTTHILFFTLIYYFLGKFNINYINWLSSILLALTCPFMLSNYKSYKIKNYWIFALVIFCIISTCLIYEYYY